MALSRCYTPTSLEQQVGDVLDDMAVDYSAQHPSRLGFVLDFAIFDGDKKIAIEVDGPMHDSGKAHSRDAFRSLLLKSEGWCVYRIHHTRINEARSIIEEILYDASN